MGSKPRRSKTPQQALRYDDENFSFPGGIPRPAAVSSKGSVPGIVETLYSEHRYIGSLLDLLEQQVAKLVPGKIPDYHLALDVLDYLTHYPDKYHHPREDMLFAALLQHDRSFRKQLERLEREHRTLHGYNDELFTELSAIARGRRVEQAELRASLERYVTGYRKHMDFESREIFPLARGQLSDAELAMLEEKTRYIDDPLFGRRLEKRFRRLARNVQSRVEDLGAELAQRELSVIENSVSRINEVVKAADEALERLGAGAWRRIPGRGPSWQARMVNGFTRLTFKPLMRYGSIASARTMTTSFEAQQAALLPADIRAQAVNKQGYEGEWVRIAGTRARKTLLYFPGGAFIIRTATQHKGFVAKICRAAKARALIVHYRLAPEVPFPGGLEDCLAAYHDLLDQGVDPDSITIAGDSAGGGLVLSTLLALRDEGTPMPKNAIVLSPLADLTYSGRSRVTNKYRDPMLPTHRASDMHELYIGDASPRDRFLSPVFADFDGLPPILGQVGSTEILLDDTVRSAERAAEAGVPFFLEVWRELPHVFPIFGVIPEAQVAIDRMAAFIDNSELDPLPEKYGWAS